MKYIQEHPRDFRIPLMAEGFDPVDPASKQLFKRWLARHREQTTYAGEISILAAVQFFKRSIRIVSPRPELCNLPHDYTGSDPDGNEMIMWYQPTRGRDLNGGHYVAVQEDPDQPDTPPPTAKVVPKTAQRPKNPLEEKKRKRKLEPAYRPKPQPLPMPAGARILRRDNLRAPKAGTVIKHGGQPRSWGFVFQEGSHPEYYQSNPSVLGDREFGIEWRHNLALAYDAATPANNRWKSHTYQSYFKKEGPKRAAKRARDDAKEEERLNNLKNKKQKTQETTDEPEDDGKGKGKTKTKETPGRKTKKTPSGKTKETPGGKEKTKKGTPSGKGKKQVVEFTETEDESETEDKSETEGESETENESEVQQDDETMEDDDALDDESD